MARERRELDSNLDLSVRVRSLELTLHYLPVPPVA